ncbi:MAG: L,D-transpeptidase [Actinobacteria bacterium]|nr:L,D-transpeptidase [Actinomycetota bacterium]
MQRPFARKSENACACIAAGDAGAASALAGDERVVRRPARAARALTHGVGAAIVLSAAMWSWASASHAAEVPLEPQEVAELKQTVLVRAEPHVDAEQRGYVAARRPITKQATTLPVLEKRRTGDDQRLWLLVRTPGRGTLRTGWIPASSRIKREVGWRIYIDRSERRARIYHLGVERNSFRIVVGKPHTPTPLGSFFVEENTRQPPSEGIGPYAIALSARSGVYRQFEGGPGQIALHGTGRLPGALGSASSHGCIRFANKAINWLGERIDAGTPVTIEA